MVWLAAELSKVEDPAEQAELAKEAATGRLKRDELKKRTSTPRKSRGVGKTRKITSRVFRTSAGLRITIELKRGLDGPTALATVEEVARQLRDELGTRDQAAA
jgi:ParB family transcriptional regulator, chromosome partitioning protein